MLLHVRVVTADGMDNWEAPVSCRSSVMIPKELLQEYGLELAAPSSSVVEGTAAGPDSSSHTSIWSQTEFVLPQGGGPAATEASACKPASAAVEVRMVACPGGGGDRAPPPRWLKVRSTAKSILVHCPFVVENLCPRDISVTMFASSEPDAAPASAACLVHAGSSREQYSVAASAESAFFMAVALENFAAVSRARLLLQASDAQGDACVNLKDSSGRVLELRLKLYEDIHGDVVVCVFPQMVVVNRSQVPLRFGRCKQLPAAQNDGAGGGAGANPPHGGVGVAAGGHAGTPVTVAPEGATVTGLYVEEAAGQDLPEAARGNATRATWHAQEPEVVIFSLPEGPEWSPCVQLPGSSQWTRISRAEFVEAEESDDDEEEEEEEQGEGRPAAAGSRPASSFAANVAGGTDALRLVSRLELMPEEAGLHSARPGGGLGHPLGPPPSGCVELGIEMRVGSGAFRDSVYMEILPEVTFINRSARIVTLTRVSAAGGPSGKPAVAGKLAAEQRAGAGVLQHAPGEEWGGVGGEGGLQLAPGEQLCSLGAFPPLPGADLASPRYCLSVAAGSQGDRRPVLTSFPFSVATDGFFPLRYAAWGFCVGPIGLFDRALLIGLFGRALLIGLFDRAWGFFPLRHAAWGFCVGLWVSNSQWGQCVLLDISNYGVSASVPENDACLCAM